MFDIDALNPAFADLGAEFEPYEENDDFPMYLEYDEGENDMYADGDGFFTNDE